MSVEASSGSVGASADVIRASSGSIRDFGRSLGSSSRLSEASSGSIWASSRSLRAYIFVHIAPVRYLAEGSYLNGPVKASGVSVGPSSGSIRVLVLLVGGASYGSVTASIRSVGASIRLVIASNWSIGASSGSVGTSRGPAEASSLNYSCQTCIDWVILK